MTCPVCQGQSIRRSSRRTMLEKFWSRLGRFPFRCYDCQTRFFRFRENVPHRDEEAGHEDVNAPAAQD